MQYIHVHDVGQVLAWSKSFYVQFPTSEELVRVLGGVEKQLCLN